MKSSKKERKRETKKREKGKKSKIIQLFSDCTNTWTNCNYHASFLSPELLLWKVAFLFHLHEGQSNHERKMPFLGFYWASNPIQTLDGQLGNVNATTVHSSSSGKFLFCLECYHSMMLSAALAWCSHVAFTSTSIHNYSCQLCPHRSSNFQCAG